MVHRDQDGEDSGGVISDQAGYGFADGNCGCVIFDNWDRLRRNVFATCSCWQGPPGRRRLLGRSARRNFRSAGDSHWLRTWRIATKSANDGKYLSFLKVIEREADDDRNFVRKAVNWG